MVTWPFFWKRPQPQDGFLASVIEGTDTRKHAFVNICQVFCPGDMAKSASEVGAGCLRFVVGVRLKNVKGFLGACEQSKKTIRSLWRHNLHVLGGFSLNSLLVWMKVLKWQTTSMEEKETLGDGCGRNYANSQSANQNRQDAISRVSAVQNSARGPRWEHWRSGGWNIQSHQQCRLRRNGNINYCCSPLHLDSMHAAQKPKSKLKFVTLDKESNMSTLWRREGFLRTCSK